MLLPAEIMRVIYQRILEIYQRILERMEARNYPVFGKRITFAPWHRLAMAIQVWLATRSMPLPQTPAARWSFPAYYLPSKLRS